jgi:hypothetical protein
MESVALPRAVALSTQKYKRNSGKQYIAYPQARKTHNQKTNIRPQRKTPQTSAIKQKNKIKQLHL